MGTGIAGKVTAFVAGGPKEGGAAPSACGLTPGGIFKAKKADGRGVASPRLVERFGKARQANAFQERAEGLGLA